MRLCLFFLLPYSTHNNVSSLLQLKLSALPVYFFGGVPREYSGAASVYSVRCLCSPVRVQKGLLEKTVVMVCGAVLLTVLLLVSDTREREMNFSSHTYIDVWLRQMLCECETT